jgi:PleD family two-component response regulator
MLTSETSAETVSKALAAGASDYQARPFNTSELYMRVRNLLQIRFLHRQLQNQNETLEMKVAGTHTRDCMKLSSRSLLRSGCAHSVKWPAGSSTTLTTR